MHSSSRQKFNKDTPLKDSKVNVFFPMMFSTLKRCIERCQDDHILRHKGIRIEKVIVMGRIVGFENERNRLTLYLEDSTGLMPIVFHKLVNEQLPEMLQSVELRENVYLKAFCTLKVGSEKIMICELVSQVKDSNLIANHIYSSLHALISCTLDVDLDTSNPAGHDDN